jgi:hypothetical protein
MIHTLHRCLRLDDGVLFEKLSFQVKSFYDVDTLEYLTIMDKGKRRWNKFILHLL